MDYVGHIYRPPSEARSLLLQVTIGCSHNSCTYCNMYGDKSFTTKSMEIIEQDLEKAARVGPGSFRRVFLCDGDALILSTGKLLKILAAIRKHLPWVERVGTYGDTRGVGRKSVEDLKALQEAGLGIVYHGMESGDDEVLVAIDKGGTRAEAVETARKLRAAGIVHSVMVLLGVGGQALSEQHAKNTGTALSAMDPDYIGVLTTTVVPGTRMAEQEAAGEFVLPEHFRLIEELRTIVAGIEVTNCRFSSNHASNYLPIKAQLPRDKSGILEALDQIIADRDMSVLKPEHLRGL